MYKQNSFCDKLINVAKKKIQRFGDESSLHGVRHVCSTSFIPFFKRLFWLIILTCCGLGFAAVLRGALHLYSEDLVSYSVETNYLSWDTSFPAVTVCEPLDDERVKSFLVKNDLPSTTLAFFKEIAYYNVKYCRSCNNCKMNKTCVENYLQYIPKIRRNCSEILTDCWWANEKFNCCDRFLPFETEYGVCFSFNNILLNNASSLIVNRKIGLPNLMLSASSPVMLRVHAPTDRISVSMDNILGHTMSYVPLVSDFDAIIKAEQTISDVSVTTLSVALRGCLFKHERPTFAKLWPFKEYTYNACVLYCRATEQAQLCNCTHHYMPQLNKLITVDCECPMACEETEYKLVHAFSFRHPTATPELLKRGTRARIRLGQLPSLRVRRQAIRDMMGLVVDIGGVGGVFFGASLLSIIEIVYLLFLRRE